ncbi:TfoX/Sxy family protein [Polymorphobacter sp.]|uniref:TfoX/Sxy family protein n=1 Tax=Polymorphobacter sp. TaxID=1909290 RepID=UPI003F706D58
MSSVGAFVSEALAPMGMVRVKAMFGGEGVSIDGFSVGLIAGDILYLKVDPGDVARYEAAGLGPFVYEKDGKPVVMSYRQAPAAAHVDAEVLREWAGPALAAAQKAIRSAPRRAPRGALTRPW